MKRTKVSVAEPVASGTVVVVVSSGWVVLDGLTREDVVLDETLEGLSEPVVGSVLAEQLAASRRENRQANRMYPCLKGDLRYCLDKDFQFLLHRIEPDIAV